MPDVMVEGAGGQITSGGDVIDDDGARWLHVLSSHYYTESSPMETPVVERWLGLVQNLGPVPVCNASVVPRLYDSDGELILNVGAAFIQDETYSRPDIDEPLTCVLPGERAIASALVYPEAPVDLSRVAEVRYVASGATYDDVERTAWVSVENEEVVDDAGGKVVRGTLVNGEVELAWWNVHVFALGTDGVPLAAQDLTDGVTGIDPESEWDFESAPFEVQSFTGYRAIVSHSGPRD